MSGQSAVFLDRDGVLNSLISRDGGMYSPLHAKDFEIFPWVAASLLELSRAGYCLVVVTNQPEISRGRMQRSELDLMHAQLHAIAKVDAIYCCPHDAKDGCSCRKPQIGMFLAAARELDINLTSSWTIGDRDSDLVAGLKAGTRVIHVASGQEPVPSSVDVLIAETLVEATKLILSQVLSCE